MIRRRTLVLGLVALATGIAWQIANRDPMPEILRQLREAWPKPRLDFDEEDPQWERCRSLVQAHGTEGGRALLRLLLEQHAARDRGSVFTGPAELDGTEPAWLLGEVAGPATVDRMLRLLPDRSLHPELRRALVIALCRTGEPRAMDALVGRAMDRQEDNELRRAILVRLPRFESDPPACLHELLYQPFARLDLFAAATLACMGDFEAPSLLAEGLAESDRDLDAPRHFAIAVAKLTGRETPIELENGDVVTAPHEEAIAAWLAAHEPDTGFERRRREYLASERRRRELADLPAEGDDFDLAAASLLVIGREAEDRGRCLGKLDRLARFLRGKIEGVADAEGRIAVLNEWLTRSHVVRNAWTDALGGYSFVDAVLRDDTGNCLGHSTLYLAMAERLGLPLHGVAAPNHCFVRWDDGRVRRNIETTARGQARPDESYVPEDVRRAAPGLFLRNLTKREVLARILSNRSSTLMGLRHHAEAAEAASRAIALDPGHHLAYVNRAWATFQSVYDSRSDVVHDLERAARLLPVDPALPLGLAVALRAYGEPAGALDALDGLASSPDVLAVRASCLARLGREAEALDLLRAAERTESVVGTELTIRVRLAPETAADLVAGAGADLGRVIPSLVAAEALLDAGHPAAALDLLERLPPRVGRGQTLDMDEFLDPTVEPWTLGDRRHSFQALRARALWEIGRADEARAALAAAQESGRTSRLLLEVERIIRG